MKCALLRVCTFSAVFCVVVLAQPQPQVNPFAGSQWAPPPGYNGPLFKLSHHYPETPPPQPANPPWLKVLQGKPLSADNALLYVQALKDYVATDMRQLIFNYGQWDPEKAHWYDMPWIFASRDPLHGTYQAGSFDPSVFPLSHMTQNNMTTHMSVYYNDVAGYTLGQVWGKDAKNPDLKKFQFMDGAIVIKVAFTTALAKDWSPMEGSALWEVYPPVPGPDHLMHAPRQVMPVALFQLDIIVKDTKAAPRTGWVFTTLTYNKNIKGDVWERMVPLGAMWGNDPDTNSWFAPNATLEENVINPTAPLYATETLGYGGRLSGPNDGAISQGNLVEGHFMPRLSISSCMSCHGVAEWPMKSNLTPQTEDAPSKSDPTLAGGLIPAPGSHAFNRWFQDRPGNVPQDAGSIALDYDMNMTLKALPAWFRWKSSQQPPIAEEEVLSQMPPQLRPLLLRPEVSSKTGGELKVPGQH